MNTTFKKLFKYTITFILLIAVYVIVLNLIGKIPHKMMEKNIKESAYTIYNNKDRFIEGYTDAIMLDICYNNDSNNSLKSILKNKIVSNDKTGLYYSKKYEGTEAMISEYEEILDDEDNIKYNCDYNYSRYWHGYLIFLMPLLTVFNINGINLLCAIISLILLIYVEFAICQKIGKKYAIYFLLLLFSIGYGSAWQKISFIPTYFIMMIFSIVVLNRKNDDNIDILFLINGSLTAFFCWMNFTLITWGIPLIFYYLTKNNNEYSLKEFFKITIIYIIAYIGTWFSKWMISDLLCQTSTIKDGIKQALYRAGNTNETKDKISYFYVVKVNFMNYLYSFIIFYAYFEIFMLRKKFNKFYKNEIIVHTLIAISPFIVYLFTRNHSFIHAEPMTHRMLILTIFSQIALLEKKIDYEFELQKSKKSKGILLNEFKRIK